MDEFIIRVPYSSETVITALALPDGCPSAFKDDRAEELSDKIEPDIFSKRIASVNKQIVDSRRRTTTETVIYVTLILYAVLAIEMLFLFKSLTVAGGIGFFFGMFEVLCLTAYVKYRIKSAERRATTHRNLTRLLASYTTDDREAGLRWVLRLTNVQGTPIPFSAKYKKRPNAWHIVIDGVETASDCGPIIELPPYPPPVADLTLVATDLPPSYGPR